MAKQRIAKGDTLVCVPCGAELIVSNVGTAYAEQWCCGVPMKNRPPKAGAARAAAAGKAVAGKAAAKRPAAKKAAPKKAAAKRKR